MVSATEMQRLHLTIADADDLARQGEHARGYAALIRGLAHAEKLLIAGENSAGELVMHWREAIDRYCDRQSAHDDADEEPEMLFIPGTWSADPRGRLQHQSSTGR